MHAVKTKFHKDDHPILLLINFKTAHSLNSDKFLDLLIQKKKKKWYINRPVREHLHYVKKHIKKKKKKNDIFIQNIGKCIQYNHRILHFYILYFLFLVHLIKNCFEYLLIYIS